MTGLICISIRNVPRRKIWNLVKTFTLVWKTGSGPLYFMPNSEKTLNTSQFSFVKRVRGRRNWDRITRERKEKKLRFFCLFVQKMLKTKNCCFKWKAVISTLLVNLGLVFWRWEDTNSRVCWTHFALFKEGSFSERAAVISFWTKLNQLADVKFRQLWY